MILQNELLQGYENTELLNYKELTEKSPRLIPYSDLANREVEGVLKSCLYINDKLYQLYSEHETHVGVIAATRMGKTTQYVIPTVVSFARQKRKKSMVISDPKGELYRQLSQTLRDEGYRVKLLNFRNFQYSECWNPLTPIYDKYMKVCNIENEVEVVQTPNGLRNKFMETVYESQSELDIAVARMKKLAEEDVANEVDNVATRFISIDNPREPYWSESARDLLRACIWAMLEDTQLKDSEPINRDTFSFRTILSIMDSLSDDDSDHYRDNGYFSNRPHDSRAYILAKNCILENGRPTRKCIVSMFNTGLSVFKTSTVKLLTSCNSFDMSELTDEEHPIAIFISYMDESKTHYKVIASFIQSAYSSLIQYANDKPNGKLDTPFYFILDEFGSLPVMNDFDTIISACGGRNIFFILIMQSYAQLTQQYGPSIAEIIKDNICVHVFMGSNNPPTLEAFSRECGQKARIAPVSALVGSGDEIEGYHIETLPLMPQSTLAKLQPGECIVTEANCGYVMFSRLERYYLCREFNNLPTADVTDYVCPVNPLDDKYVYKYPPQKPRRRFDFDF